MNVPIPLIATIVGSLLGVLISLVFGVVSKWRQSEQNRHRVRSFLTLLKIELEARKNCLDNKGRVPDKIDFATVKPPFSVRSDYHDRVDDYRLVFEKNIENLGAIDRSLAERILKHYHRNDNYLDREYKYLTELNGEHYGTKQQQAFFTKLYQHYANEASEITEALQREILVFQSQSFIEWLRKWFTNRP